MILQTEKCAAMSPLLHPLSRRMCDVDVQLLNFSHLRPQSHDCLFPPVFTRFPRFCALWLNVGPQTAFLQFPRRNAARFR